MFHTGNLSLKDSSGPGPYLPRQCMFRCPRQPDGSVPINPANVFLVHYLDGFNFYVACRRCLCSPSWISSFSQSNNEPGCRDSQIVLIYYDCLQTSWGVGLSLWGGSGWNRRFELKTFAPHKPTMGLTLEAWDHGC